MKKIHMLLINLIVLTIIGCGGGDMNEPTVKYSTLAEVPDSRWNELSTKTIYFGHQSVGQNILDGIQEVLNANPEIKLNIVESKDFENTKSGALFHSAVGENTKPLSKIKEFEHILTSKNNKSIDYAFLKFCYIDFMPGTDAENVYDEYAGAIERIKAKNSNTKILHITTPLTTVQGGIKGYIKRKIGRPLHGSEQNKIRNLYNDMLIGKSGKTDPVFNLAEIESTKTDGKRMSFEYEGKTYYALNPNYSSDGGHLNEKGRKIVAEKLLLFLVNRLQ